jgi:hypothetical protein
LIVKKFGFIAVALLLAGTHQAAFAQSRGKTAARPAAAKAAAKPAAASSVDSESLSAQQRDHAIQDFGVMSSAMRSDKVPDDVKSALMGCIYANSLGKISTAIDKVSADNPGKVDRKNADSVLGAMAAICGYQPSASAPAAPAPSAPPAKPQQGAPVGR